MLTKERILIVEDSSGWSDTLRSLLAAEEYEVEVAVRYTDALGIVLANEGVPQSVRLALVVCDLRLAGNDRENYDGLGLLGVCKLRAIPTLVVSGYLDDDTVRELRNQFGVLGIFRKASFDERAFIDKAKSATGLTGGRGKGSIAEDITDDNGKFFTEQRAVAVELNEQYVRAFSHINDTYRSQLDENKAGLSKRKSKWVKKLNELDQQYRAAREELRRAETWTDLDKLRSYVSNFAAQEVAT